MPPVVKFCLPGGHEFSWLNSVALLRIKDDALDALITECELALEATKMEQRRRRGIVEQPSPHLWKAVQSFHLPSPKATPWFKQESASAQTREQRTLTLVSRLTNPQCAERLSIIPRSTIARLDGPAKVAFIRLSHGPWSIEDSSHFPATKVSVPNSDRENDIQLDEDSRDLVRVITFAGGEVPKMLLEDACSPKFWGSDGEVQQLHLDLVGVFSTERLNQTIEVLSKAGGISSTHDRISLDSRLVNRVLKTEPNTSKWRNEALRVTLAAFPKDSNIDPVLYTKKGVAMIPYLCLLFPSFWEDNRLPTRLYLDFAFESLLSASYFADQQTKKYLAKLAEELAHLLLSPILLARALSRKASLARLYDKGSQVLDTYFPTPCPGIEPRSNAWLGHIVLTTTQFLMDKMAPTQQIIDSLQALWDLGSRQPSRQEQFVMIDGRLMIGKSFRFEGSFEMAAGEFNEVFVWANKLGGRATLKVLSQLAEVKSEMGLYTEAISLLADYMEFISAYQTMDRGLGKRLRIALANCYLMKVLWIWKRERRLDISRDVALKLFDELDSAYTSGAVASETAKHNKFVIQSGRAMLHHIAKHWEDASRYWGAAEIAAREFGPDRGWAAMITSYSLSDLHRHIGDTESVKAYRVDAEAIWSNLGRRQFYFTGLGSIWPDILGSFDEQSGVVRIIPPLED